MALKRNRFEVRWLFLKIVLSLLGKECKLESNPSIFWSGFRLLPAWKISPILTRSQTVTCLRAPSFRLTSFIWKCFAKCHSPCLESLTQASPCRISRSEACIHLCVWNACSFPPADTELCPTCSQGEEHRGLACSFFQASGMS